MAEAVDLAKLHGPQQVTEALQRSASYGRFADGDLARILAHQQQATVIALPNRAPEDASLQASSRSWEGWAMTIHVREYRTARALAPSMDMREIELGSATTPPRPGRLGTGLPASRARPTVRHERPRRLEPPQPGGMR